MINQDNLNKDNFKNTDPENIDFRQLNNLKKKGGKQECEQCQFLFLFSNSPIPVIIFSLDGRVKEMNIPAKRMYNIAEEDISKLDVYSNINNAFPLPTPEIFEQALNGNIQTLQPIELVVECENPVGKKNIWIEPKLFPVYNFKQDLAFIGQINHDITSLIETQTKLQESQELYYSIVNLQSDIIFRIDTNNNITYANSNFCKLVNLDEDEIIGSSILPYLAEESIENSFELLKNTKPENPNIRKREKLIINNEEKYFDFDAKIIFDEYSTITEIQAIGRDITELVQASQALTESEEQFKLFIEQSHDGVWVIDEQGYTKYINQRMAEMLQYEITDFYRIPIFHFIDAKLIPLQEYYSIVCRNGEKLQYDFEFVRKDSQNLYVSISASPVYGADKSFIGTIYFISDITKRYFAEKELKKSEERYKYTLEAIPDTMLTFTNSGSIISIQGAPDDLFGDKGNIIGKHLNRIFEDEIASQFILAVSDFVVSRKVQNFDFSISKNSTVQYFDARIIGISDNEYLAILRNITDKKMAEYEINTLNLSLEKKVIERTTQLASAMEKLSNAKEEISGALAKEKELNNLKSRFITTISHEYRTPLTVINSSVNLIERYFDKLSKDDIFNYIEKINRAVGVLTHLVEEVLIIGKAEKGKMTVKKEYMNITEFCEKVVDEIQLTDGNQHQIVKSFDSFPNAVYSDPNLIRLIINNLLSNAIKYSAKDSIVKIRLQNINDKLIITIEDNGIGIPENEVKYLFDEFHRGFNVGMAQGTGLGLSIVKYCIQSLGGEIQVKSEVNKGTTFVVHLPIN
jgi:PAS domain S-box-containing protein